MIIATNNKGKIAELKRILTDYELYSLKDKNIEIDVLEDANTFVGNATKKAIEIYNLTQEETIADDSGLCITALDDFPGVMTHRFLGPDASDLERNNYLIEMVNKKNDRRAKVICDLVYYDGMNTIIGEGILNGFIATSRRGTNGFGFDEIFELEDGRTLAELLPEEKNELSARYLAAVDLKNKLKTIKYN